QFPLRREQALRACCEKQERLHHPSVNATICLPLRPDGTARSRAQFLLTFESARSARYEQLRVTDDVDEQHVPNLEFDVGRMLGRHTISFYLETPHLTSRFQFTTSHRPQAPKHCAASVGRKKCPNS